MKNQDGASHQERFVLHQNAEQLHGAALSEDQAREPAQGGAGPLVLGLSRPPHCHPPPRVRGGGGDGSCAVRCVWLFRWRQRGKLSPAVLRKHIPNPTEWCRCGARGADTEPRTWGSERVSPVSPGRGEVSSARPSAQAFPPGLAKPRELSSWSPGFLWDPKHTINLSVN